MSNISTPYLENWQRIYELASKIRGLEPWDDFPSNKIIGIEIPLTKEIVYCSIINNDKGFYGLFIMDDNLKYHYREFYYKNGYIGEINKQGFIIQYVNHDYIFKSFKDPLRNEFLFDRQIIKKIKFKPVFSELSYPLFRYYLSEEQPCNLSDEQVNFLVPVIEQLLEIIKGYWDKKEIIFSRKKFEYPVWYFVPDCQDWILKKVIVKPEPENDLQFYYLK